MLFYSHGWWRTVKSRWL